MHRISSGNGQPVVRGIRNPASDHLAGQPTVQQPFFLLILCIDVQKNSNFQRHG